MRLKAEIEGHVVSLVVDQGTYMDAAVTSGGGLAAIELAVSPSITINPKGEREYPTTDPVLILSMHPDTLRAMAHTILQKTGAPAFTESEWKRIAMALRDAGPHVTTVEQSWYNELAARIDKAYERETT